MVFLVEFARDGSRNESCSIVLPHISVSRRHALLLLKQSSPFSTAAAAGAAAAADVHAELHDLGAVNGTSVNGRRLRGRAVLPLLAGAEILFACATCCCCCSCCCCCAFYSASPLASAGAFAAAALAAALATALAMLLQGVETQGLQVLRPRSCSPPPAADGRRRSRSPQRHHHRSSSKATRETEEETAGRRRPSSSSGKDSKAAETEAKEKRKLLWGKKKPGEQQQQQEEEETDVDPNKYALSFGGDTEKKSKFLKLMGHKGDPSFLPVAAEITQGEAHLDPKQTQRINCELELQYYQGIRRKDGRKTGLGL
ncbi:hypothetical protein Esti_000649 [Eimeria stiedai]